MHDLCQQFLLIHSKELSIELELLSSYVIYKGCPESLSHF